MENSNTYNPERKLWLDALRGLAIILVVWGHQVSTWYEFFVVTSPVKMPLFFAISGYLFNSRNGNQRLFYKNMFFKIIAPWMILGLFPYTNIPNKLIALISGKSLWFMPCLVIAEIIYFYVHKFLKTTFSKFFVSLLLCVIGFIFHSFHILRFGMIDTAFIVQPFFVIGLLIRINEKFLACYWKKWTLISVILYLLLIGLSFVFYSGKSLDVHLNRYYNIPFCGLMITIGCVTLFTVFRQCEVSTRWLVYIGQNTLVIYILHGYVIAAVLKAMDFLHISVLQHLQLAGLIRTVIGLSICCLIAFFINKYVPIAAGKWSPRK